MYFLNLQDSLYKIHSRKFLPLMYQLAARLGTRSHQNELFQTTLNEVDATLLLSLSPGSPPSPKWSSSLSWSSFIVTAYHLQQRYHHCRPSFYDHEQPPSSRPYLQIHAFASPIVSLINSDRSVGMALVLGVVLDLMWVGVGEGILLCLLSKISLSSPNQHHRRIIIITAMDISSSSSSSPSSPPSPPPPSSTSSSS